MGNFVPRGYCSIGKFIRSDFFLGGIILRQNSFDKFFSFVFGFTAFVGYFAMLCLGLSEGARNSLQYPTISWIRLLFQADIMRSDV